MLLQRASIGGLAVVERECGVVMRIKVCDFVFVLMAVKEAEDA